VEYQREIDVSEQLRTRAEFQVAMFHFNKAMSAKPTYLEAGDRYSNSTPFSLLKLSPSKLPSKIDGNTWVSIGAYKNLGKIDSMTVRIFPGDYQIIDAGRTTKTSKCCYKCGTERPLPRSPSLARTPPEADSHDFPSATILDRPYVHRVFLRRIRLMLSRSRVIAAISEASSRDGGAANARSTAKGPLPDPLLWTARRCRRRSAPSRHVG